VPTKAKGRQSEVALGSLEEQLRRLEEQRERASGMVLEADNEASEIKQRQDSIAVAAVSEEPEALEEMATLEEALLVATRRGGVARSAVGQLEEQIERAREDLAEAEREVHRERFEEMGRERHALEERLEEQLGAFLGGLAELRDLDHRQRLESYEAGVDDAFARSPLGDVVAAWLSSRFGGAGGFLPLTVSDWHRDHALAELDGLARDPAERS
jgi:chromosome segregation ATPase